MSEIVLADNYEIVTQQGRVEFKGYEQMKESVIKLSKQLETVEATEENVKESKRLLAEINKQLKIINDQRKQSKAILLEPYQVMENQVKEIEEILKTPTEQIRYQIRELEDKERDEKRDKLEELFNKRIKNYSISDVFTFDDFIKPQHLNKSTSLKSVEAEMTEFMEQTQNDIKVIYNLENSGAVMVEYKECMNLSTAMNIVKEREERERQLEAIRKQREEEAEKKRQELQGQSKIEPAEKSYSFVIKGDKNAQLVELLLEKADIDFEKVEM